MSITLQALKAAIKPSKTALLLGAGASVPSGGPTGAQLAERLWRKVADSDPKSDDLLETSTILVRRYGRKAVVDEIVSALTHLRPTGGMQGLPDFGWEQVFTTNFDRIIEKAFRLRKIPAVVIRSNYDFTNKESNAGTRIFKIHGCITQDETLGHKASMLLTEEDYEKYEKFRQTTFSLLQAALTNGDVLVIGQSLRDRHLFELIKRVQTAKLEGAPGTVYALIYDKDDLRAPLLEDKGVKVAFGGIDEFVHAMAVGFQPVTQQAAVVDGLPVSIVSTVHEVFEAAKASSNVTRMFNGGSATYADIRAGATFERANRAEALERLKAGKSIVVPIVGAAGVGKTTFARQLMLDLSDAGHLAWEHRGDFYFDFRAWTVIEAQLRSSDKTAFLLIDECTAALRGINELINHLAGLETPALRLVLTANSAQWAPRIKSPNIFAKGYVVELSRLNNAEINSLVNLVAFNKEISALVGNDFKRQGRPQQIDTLRQKCSADMFVCLSNIFANESLDIILLQEYDALQENLQEYYRYVAGLEAVGMRVHRQLLVRMLNLPPAQIAAALSGLSGIVDEFEIKPKEGIYGWSTRHVVIARKISEYKFSSFDELKQLFEAIVNNINPAVSIELQSIRSICDSDFGIGRIGDGKTRRDLYRKLIEVAPGERIPWHRLIRELLNEGTSEEIEYVIRNAETAVGNDAPIARYKVRLLVNRAKTTQGISRQDRVALLRKAYELASRNIGYFSWDKYSFRELCEVAVLLVQRGESPYILDEAIAKMRVAADRILDPDMAKELHRFEVERSKLG
jgi:GTPase SAR1 family protein